MFICVILLYDVSALSTQRQSLSVCVNSIIF